MVNDIDYTIVWGPLIIFIFCVHPSLYRLGFIICFVGTQKDSIETCNLLPLYLLHCNTTMQNTKHFQMFHGLLSQSIVLQSHVALSIFTNDRTGLIKRKTIFSLESNCKRQARGYKSFLNSWKHKHVLFIQSMQLYSVIVKL